MAITLDELLNRNRNVETHTQQPYGGMGSPNSPNNDNDEHDQMPTLDELKHKSDMPKFEKYNYTQESSQSQNLYEFTRKDNDRLSQQELYARLAHTNDSRRPVFNQEEVEQIENQKHGVFQHRAQVEEAPVENKKKFHLNLKGKLIIAAYVAVVAVVAGLIIANSSNLNAGTATTPSSSVSDYAIVEVIK